MTSVLLASDPDRLSVILPAIDTGRFRETVADFGDPALAMDRFDCVVPFTLDDYAHLRRRPDHHRVNCLMPQSALVEILDDKYRCNRLLTALGFGGNIPAMDERMTAWPIIYKKKLDSTGRHSFLCFCKADLRILEASTLQEEYFKGIIPLTTLVYSNSISGMPLCSSAWRSASSMTSTVWTTRSHSCARTLIAD